ncbi:MAG: hypothetical protein Kow00120_23070 [Anaerolineae bacterium]
MRRSTILRWAAAVGWTGLVVALTLLPGSSRVVHDASAWFGGTELTDAIGHFLLFLVLAVTWQGALASWLERSRALLAAGGFAGALGAVVEIGQVFIPGRGSGMLDLAANWMGVAAALLLSAITDQVRRRHSAGE